MKEPVLRASSLEYRRQSRKLLDDVSVELYPGELVGIIGPNGAGKSTLLKSLVGINQPQSGTVIIENTPLTQLTHLQRAEKISYLAQRQEAAFPFTVEQTICLGAYQWQHASHSGQPQLEQRLSAIIEQLDLQPLLGRKLDELSGGETQLVHFARILMQDTQMMLLDEPTAALDIGHEAQLMNLLRQQCRHGYGALVAIHNLNIAAAFCDRLILLDQGKVIASGRAEDVITQAQINSLYAQQVMVSQNPVSGTVTVLPMPEKQQPKDFTVHIVGGAGSTVALVRACLQMGIRVTAGIGHEQDSDTEYWQATGVEHIRVPAFSAITESDLQPALDLVNDADLTIFTEFPIGTMNEKNLTLAMHSANLWILQESHSDQQRFYSTDLHIEFSKLSEKAQILTSLAAIEKLKSILS